MTDTCDIRDIVLRGIYNHMGANGKAMVSVNGIATAEVRVDLSTGKVSVREISPDNTAADAIIDYLNSAAGTRYQRTAKNRGYINARLAEGHTEEECRRVIDNRWEAWRGTCLQEYMRPCTLFNSEKFEGYLAAAKAGVKKSNSSYFMNYNQRRYTDAELAGICVDLTGALWEDKP